MGTQVKTPQTSYVGKEFLSNKGYIRRNSFSAPAAASATAVHAAISTAAVITTGITNPDVPRNITITGAGSSHSASGNVTINGTDIRGNTISEAIALNSNTTVAGSKAFKTVTSIDTSAVSGIDSNDTVTIGIGTKIGLDRLMTDNGVFLATVDGAADSALPTVAFSSSNIANNTVVFATAPNAAHNYVVTFVSTELRSQP